MGHGRKRGTQQSAAQIETIALPQGRCPHCRVALEERGVRERTVIDCPPVHPRTTIYRLQVKRCPCCLRTFQAQAPAVLPHSLYGLYGNQLLTHIAVHYAYGVPLGRLEAQTGIGYGSLMDALHRLGPCLPASPRTSCASIGARTRETLMTVLGTLHRRLPDFEARFKTTLDILTHKPSADPYKLLFHNHLPP